MLAKNIGSHCLNDLHAMQELRKIGDGNPEVIGLNPGDILVINFSN